MKGSGLAKRTRGKETRRPTAARRPAAPRTPAVPRPAAAAGFDARPVASETPSELDAATDVAEAVLDGRPASAAGQLRQARGATPARSRAKPSNLLATQAANEYVYVAQDIRRIGVVAAGLFATMLVLWLLIVVLRVIPT